MAAKNAPEKKNPVPNLGVEVKDGQAVLTDKNTGEKIETPTRMLVRSSSENVNEVLSANPEISTEAVIIASQNLNKVEEMVKPAKTGIETHFVYSRESLAAHFSTLGDNWGKELDKICFNNQVKTDPKIARYVAWEQFVVSTDGTTTDLVKKYEEALKKDSQKADQILALASFNPEIPESILVQYICAVPIPSLIAKLLMEKYPETRRKIARNPNAPKSALKELELEVDPSTMQSLCANPNVDPQFLLLLWQDVHSRRQVADWVVHNPACPNDLLGKIQGEPRANTSAREIAFKRLSGQESTKSLDEQHALSTIQSTQVMVSFQNPQNMLVF